MRVQIYGAGIAGSYLYELLTQNGFDVSIYDVRSKPDCRCAWGIAYDEGKELYKLIGINLDDYILAKPKYLVANNKLWFKNKNVVIFDRKRLLEELWKNMEFKDDGKSADIIVDATGYSRAILPKVQNDKIYPMVQAIERHELDENVYVQMRKTGYAWAFPLGNNRWHIGAGELTKERAMELVEELKRTYGLKSDGNECYCTAKIRMVPPQECKPIVHGNVFGVGEAVGCVSGGGEGNAPSLRCAKIFYDCLANNELESYESKVLEEFRWIKEEHDFVRAVQEGRRFTALRLLPKFVSIESKRSANLSIKSVKSLIDMLKG
jgi:flavin-dependent dehydrogenase